MGFFDKFKKKKEPISPNSDVQIKAVIENIENKEGLVVSKNINVNNGHTLILGGSGSGKTRNFIIPNVINATGNIVCITVGEDVITECKESLTSKSYVVEEFLCKKASQIADVDNLLEHYKEELITSSKFALFIALDPASTENNHIVERVLTELLNEARVAATPVHFIIDEFPSISNIKGLDKTLIEASHNKFPFTVSITAQSVNQLNEISKKVYHNETCDCLLKGIKYIIYMGGTDLDTAKTISEYVKLYKPDEFINRLSSDTLVFIIKDEHFLIDNKFELN